MSKRSVSSDFIPDDESIEDCIDVKSSVSAGVGMHVFLYVLERRDGVAAIEVTLPPTALWDDHCLGAC